MVVLRILLCKKMVLVSVLRFSHRPKGLCRKKRFFRASHLTNSMPSSLYNHYEKDDAYAL
jgi:hypothetical protein